MDTPTASGDVTTQVSGGGSGKQAFLRQQFTEARRDAGAASLALALACHSGDPDAMEAAALACASAVAELRIALRALSLNR